MTLAAFIDRNSRDKEDWKYTDLEKLLARAASPHPLPPARESLPRTRSGGRGEMAARPVSDAAQLVFVNGVFTAKQSHFGSIPSCILMGDLESGYKLTLGEHTCLVAQPLELVFATDADTPKEIAVKLSIDVGDNGRLTLLENHLASIAITTLETDITLHPRAKFVHGKIIGGGVHIAATSAMVAGGAYYNNFTLIQNAQPVRNEIAVDLTGEQAQAALNGMMLLRDRDHADTTTRITHLAPHGSSRQIYKTVVDGQARGVFQGKITVAEGAQKTDGYQLSRALLLSDQAEMDAKPELEIYADDVKCSHGSTIGDLDDDALFYLRSRGLSETEARALLIQAFMAEMLDEIPIEEWKDIFRDQIEGWLS